MTTKHRSNDSLNYSGCFTSSVNSPSMKHQPSRYQRQQYACVANILKGTLFHEPNSKPFGIEGFRVQLPKSVSGQKAIWIRWWSTRRKQDSEVSLAKLVIKRMRLNGVSIDFCIGNMRDSLRSIITDPNLFNLSEIFETRNGNLYQCMHCEFTQFADLYLRMVNHKSSLGVTRRLFIATVMPRVSGMTMLLESETLGLVNRHDQETIDRLFTTPFGAVWDSSNGQFETAENVFQKDKFSYLAFAIDRGTQDWCRERSTIRLRCLTSVLIASSIDLGRCELPMRTIAEPPREWIQFESNPTSHFWRSSASEPLLPYLAHELLVDEKTIADVHTWYGTAKKLSLEKSRRVHISAHFVNLALCSRGLDEFLFFYIALDALFGQRGSVERSIERGIASHLPDLRDRSAHLFQLRSELVHGGCRTIEEWRDYEYYVSRYGSQPKTDLMVIALRCLSRFPNLSFRK